MLDWQSLTLMLYVIARVSGMILFNPLVSRSNIPGLFRAGLVLVLSVFILSVTGSRVAVPLGVVDLSVHLLLEFALGFMLGMVIHFFLYIPQLAGHVIDTQMGMTMNQIYDSGSNANMSVTGMFLNAMMVLLFFAANGHHTLFRILITSETMVPYGLTDLHLTLVARAGLELFVECTVLAVKLSLPVLAAELLGQLGMGILMKVIPQINVFSINIELKVLIGLILLLLLVAPFSEFFLKTEITMLDSLEDLLRLAGS